MGETNGHLPRIGSWARTGELIGLVARVEEGQATLFDPGDRRAVTVPLTELQTVPAGAVTVTARVDLPLAHGVSEQALRRWVASLLDPHVRERALAALAAEGLDEGAALPQVRLDVDRTDTSGAVCLCGARVPAPPGSSVPCPACGREAVAAPPGSG